MPNHVTNQITFGTSKAALAVFRNMLEMVQANGEPLGSIDFNKLIPMPPGLNIEHSAYMEKGLELYRAYMRELDSSDPVKHFRIKQKWEPQRMADPVTWALGKQAFENIQKYGSPSWYGWAIKNWGSKWNAYQCKPLDKNADMMIFLTAWDAVPNILEAMSRRYPDQAITYRWADEDIGYNVGEKTFWGGKCVGELMLEGGSREAYELAAEIMEIKLSDFDLHLTADRCSYERREPVRSAVRSGNKRTGTDR